MNSSLHPPKEKTPIMKKFLFPLLLSQALVVFFISLPVQSQVELSVPVKDVILKVDSLLNNRNFNGSILIAEGKHILLSENYGLACPKDQKISPKTIFAVGSLAKQFTSAAALKLIEKGKLDLQQSIATIFPEKLKNKKAITIHHLLSNSSGLPANVTHPYSPIEKDSFLMKINQVQLEFDPGNKYLYSNSGFLLLGMIVEQVSGISFEDFVQQELFNPAEMEDTFLYADLKENENLACGFDTEKDNIYNPYFGDPSRPGWGRKGAGDLYTTASDLYRWHKTLFLEKKVLKAESLQTMVFPHIPETEDGQSFYGYGLVLQPKVSGADNPLVWHDGARGYFSSVYYYLPQSDIVVIMLTNNNSGGEFLETRKEVMKTVLRLVPHQEKKIER